MVFTASGTTFRVSKRYTFKKALGKGAYGVVCSAADSETRTTVAIKKITPFSKSVYDGKHTLREIRLLRHCGQHPNVITLRDLAVDEAHDELYIVMEAMDTDLHRIIQSSQSLGESHLKHFLYQLLRGLSFLHANGILHRDLKPANLLVSKDCSLRISDFGEPVRSVHCRTPVVTKIYTSCTTFPKKIVRRFCREHTQNMNCRSAILCQAWRGWRPKRTRTRT